MAEWFKAAVLKTAVVVTLPWVRIPLSPPVASSPCFTGVFVSGERAVGTQIGTQRFPMRISNYLYLAPSQVWHFRQRLSSDLAKRTGQIFIKRSLGTRDLLATGWA